MRRISLCLVLLAAPYSAFAQYEAPDVPATRPASDYPLRVHIFGVRWNRSNGSYQGYGRADLLGATPQGIDYTFSCSEPFLHNEQKGEYYQARWKKQDQKLELLMQKVGSDHLQKCELKTSLKPAPYGKYGATAASAASTSPAGAPVGDAKPVAAPPQ